MRFFLLLYDSLLPDLLALPPYDQTQREKQIDDAARLAYLIHFGYSV